MGASPDRVEDAVQEFLTDWSLGVSTPGPRFLSPRAYACLNLNEDARGQALDASGARRELRRIMTYANEKLGAHSNLTSVVSAFTPRDPERVVIDHAFKREFLLTPLTEAQARRTCAMEQPRLRRQRGPVGAVFQFRIAGGGLFGLLWTREDGMWKLVSYQPLHP